MRSLFGRSARGKLGSLLGSVGSLLVASLLVVTATTQTALALPVGNPQEAQEAANQTPTWEELDAA